MKLIYTHPNPLILTNARNLLDSANIPTTVKNEYASGAVGELSAIDTWPELWLCIDEDYSRAMHVLQPILNDEQQPAWTCDRCSEKNETSFETCWHCQAPQV